MTTWDYRYEYRDTFPATDFSVREVRSLRRTDASVPPDSKSFVWLDYVVLNNHAAKDQGENCARYTKAFDYGGGDIWAECIEVADMGFGAKYGTLRAAEVSMGVVGPDPNQWRIGYHIAVWDAKRYVGARHDGPCEVGQCFRINGEPNAYWGTVIDARDFAWAFASVTGGYMNGQPSHHIFKFGGKFITGFSFADAEFAGSPIRLGRGQTIGLEGTDSVRLGLDGDRVSILVNGAPVFAVDIWTGDVWIKGEVRKL